MIVSDVVYMVLHTEFCKKYPKESVEVLFEKFDMIAEESRNMKELEFNLHKLIRVPDPIMKIEMINDPRTTGKTTRLRLKCIEEYLTKGDNTLILFLGHNTRSSEINSKYFYKMGINVSHLASSLRGLTGPVKVKIFIDEPFIMDTRLQEELLFLCEQAECRGCDVEILGIGTHVVSERKYFKDYICE